MNKIVLITGGFGFLGRHASKHFKNQGYYVYGLGRGIWNNSEEKNWGIDDWVSSDITLEALTSLNIKPEFVVHCGGSGSVAASIKEPFSDFNKTVASTAAVLEFIRRYSPDTRLIYPSSPAVHGVHDETPIKTTDPFNPVSPYGYHKKMAEELCFLYYKEYGVKYSIIRFFSVYGEGLKKQLLWDASNKLLSEKENAEFWGTGDEVRDWINVSDAVSLLFESAHISDPTLIVNGGSGKGYKVSQALYLLKDLLGSKAAINFSGKVKEGDPLFYTADLNYKLSGWKPSITFETGLKNYADWFKRENL